MSNTIERYGDKANLSALMTGIKAYVDNSGGGGTGSDPDGTMVINRDNTGEISSIVFTYSGGVRTTTFAETSTTKYIVTRDVKTGASTATVRTFAMTASGASITTTTEPVT